MKMAKNIMVRGKIMYQNAMKAGQSKEKAGQQEILNQKSGLSLQKQDSWRVCYVLMQ